MALKDTDTANLLERYWLEVERKDLEPSWLEMLEKINFLRRSILGDEAGAGDTVNIVYWETKE